MPIGNVADLIAETLIQTGVKPYAMIGTPFGVRSRLSEAAPHSAPIIQEGRQKDKSCQE
jgi:hypothetical protein